MTEIPVAATTLMWLARLAYREIMQQQPREVATLAHERIWTVVAEREQAAGGAATPAPADAPAFPVGATFGGGAFRIDHVLRGTGMQKLCTGHEVASGAQLLIAFDACRQRSSVDELRAAVSYQAPGLFELGFAGHCDSDPAYWAVVERVTPGSWLPNAIAAGIDARGAVQLALSAGALLGGAAERGVVLAHVRPDYMWAEQTAAGWRVTGLSARGFELYSRKSYELVTHPLFDRHYHAPEHAATDVDDRAVVYALARMIGEWAGAAAPAALVTVLARATGEDRDGRPGLRAFLDELQALV